MNLVEIVAYAQAYYSEATYEEAIYITEETYNKIKEDVDELDFAIGGLDGKHSETDCEIEVDILDEEWQQKCNFDKKNDGRSLYYELIDIFRNHGLNLGEELEITRRHIENIDSIVERKIQIKKSQVGMLDEFLETLKNKGLRD